MKKMINKIMSITLVIALTITMIGNTDFNKTVKADTINYGVEVDELLE